MITPWTVHVRLDGTSVDLRVFTWAYVPKVGERIRIGEVWHAILERRWVGDARECHLIVAEVTS